MNAHGQRKMGPMTLLMLTFTALCACVEGNNLLRNPSFELGEMSAWEPTAAKLDFHQGDRTDGQWSLMVKDRKKDLSGATQVIHPVDLVTPGRGYELRADVRLLNGNPRKMFQSFKAIMVFAFTKGTAPEEKEKPNCKGLKGKARKNCIKELKRWKETAKKQREEKRQRAAKRKEQKRKNKERKKLRQQQRRKEKEERKKQRGSQKNNRKGNQQRKEERERKARERQRQRERERKKRERKQQRERKNRGIRGNNNVRADEGHVSNDDDDAVVSSSAGQGSRRDRRDVLLSRQRRQQRRQRVQRPLTTVLKTGQVVAPPDNRVILPTSGENLPENGAYIIAWRAWVTVEQGWITLVGNINAPMVEFNSVSLRIQGPDPGCNFLVDNVTLYEIPEISD